MISIDKLAYTSDLRKTNPMEKFIFSIITMILCIALNKIVISVIIFTTMTFFIVVKGKIPLNIYFKLILLPVSFLIMGILTIAINVLNNNNAVILSFIVLGFKLGVTEKSLITAGNIFFKALASVSCLYFLTLTTPLFEILIVLRRCKIPKLFVELMGLMYRFIFILMDRANMIFISQNCRLGYSNIKIGYKSIGTLITSLFVSSYKRSQDMYTSMEARCYDGEINLIEYDYKISHKNIVLIVILELILIVVGVIL
ncbi:cobalt ABC transporter, permease protein CbiQ [Clostridium pasteurianum DSM 525 = ATCC 6013]|uniref:Cobalt ABC transporter, inner membrane subunit CbiQ n=1 Tax=Clostridium pasteurianum DSM 525 = ATCC 6013 TaxID=1262449 RepID=A0A0H3J1R0_CLOPA|nr:cobalt ECF transporter T component CbiQ [Clostridium pasteurianum]AJA47349.1 cobalt ABC transporter, permease protein CbiQ [Clostridium pasteurianum DSM 525 = ATCC 6013]AJA51337.1 cobalt ABC transporter, permease protein CbiQ [Clostridium pasteurianum DSM 525 = ATCC 6013]AOZ74683.1 cobalt ABC transporter permease [Clostridium pasteurianum DSM 525 = ATCC 6013]AOZ78480.1 cobalt ABC transporter permease [Clostridium pasteurianum]ELP58688.1 hypothetical protein F502_12933 [Clostridium pasteuria